MLIIGLLNHVVTCFQKYQTRKQLNALSALQCRDIAIDCAAQKQELAKANVIFLLKEVFVGVSDSIQQPYKTRRF
ncbi:hypothetical protein [Marinomonas balearica]|uniref:Uncharacterized protein n=1 Tax=Marinomonas balearica TaxID=491947 RepID=A0A4R6MAU9_9GAMM|nr:hypothetical protein [Marinomonas balearica]TDO98688.1 hypothetical protein DFP79_1100 [Marinomonas balearica]